MMTMTNYKNTLSSLRKEQISLIAYKVLSEYTDKRLPVSPKKIVKKIPNISITTFDKEARKEHRLFSEILKQLHSNDGTIFYAGKLTNQYVISYNSRIRSKKQQRFTIAHELGHYFLGHCASSDTPTTLHRNGLTDEQYNSIELEANYFAGQLLAPKALVKKALKVSESNLPPVDIVKNVFNISSFSANIAISNDLSVRQSGALAGFSTAINQALSRYVCDNCQALFYVKNAKFCPICSSRNIHHIFKILKRKGQKFMKYSSVNTDPYGHAKVCPICHNENTDYENQEFCQICGCYLTNRCTGNSQDYYEPSGYNDDNSSFGSALRSSISDNACQVTMPSDARYCPYCGSVTTFFCEDILSPYKDELAEKKSEQTATSTEEETQASSDPFAQINASPEIEKKIEDTTSSETPDYNEQIEISENDLPF
jgi:Zn-dependent peptidase ImmA (M78 family)/RNA polymerase subunit RPABC4/transcription elongation factor Spt4